VIDVQGTGYSGRRNDFLNAVQRLVIVSRMRPAKLIASFKKSKFYLQNGSLDSIHPAVPSNHRMLMLADLAVVPKDPNFFLQRRITSHNRPGLTERSKILSGIEAKTARIAEASHSSPFVFGAVSLTSVLDNIQIVFTCDLKDRVHFGWLAKDVDWNNRFRPNGNRIHDCGWIHRVGVLIDIDEHRLGATIGDCLRSGDERVRDRDHLVAWSDTQRQKTQPKRLCAAANTNRVRTIAVSCEIRFESSDERTAGEGSGINDFPNRIDEFFP
jgi:hypothetical protein